MLVYCDSAILIYWLDQVGPFHLRAETRMLALQSAGDRIAVSHLTRLECRVGILKRRDAAALRVFGSFFGHPDVELVSLSADVFDRAAQLRADLNLKTPDALHLSAAIEAGCGRFLTNDTNLTKCTDIVVEILP